MKKREQMVVEQIKNRGIYGIKKKRVLDAMRKVARHQFVPEEHIDEAYGDHPLPIGEGQTISQPYIVALMTSVLDLNGDEKVLEVGTGSGYQAAVLAEVCDSVYSIEIIEALGLRADSTLKKLGYENIRIKTGDGYKGWKERAPFDGIIVTCAPGNVPEPLKEQLAEGGRMVIPVGGRFSQELVLIIKEKGELVQRDIIPVRFVPMVNEKGKRY